MKKYTKDEVLEIVKKAHKQTIKELREAQEKTTEEETEDFSFAKMLVTMQDLATTGLFASNIKKAFDED